MFTVKTIINGVTNVYESDRFTVAEAGSERFKEILTQTNTTSNPDFALWLPPIYEDAECKKPLQKEELIISEREDVLDENAIGILIDDYKSPISARRKAFDGLKYQFIYPGDQVYVMNSHGATIESVK